MRPREPPPLGPRQALRWATSVRKGLLRVPPEAKGRPTHTETLSRAWSWASSWGLIHSNRLKLKFAAANVATAKHFLKLHLLKRKCLKLDLLQQYLLKLTSAGALFAKAVFEKAKATFAVAAIATSKLAKAKAKWVLLELARWAHPRLRPRSQDVFCVQRTVAYCGTKI